MQSVTRFATTVKIIHSPVQGFTLIELMITIALMGLLFNLGIARYLDFNRRQSTTTIGLKLKNDLRSIQQKALSGVKPYVAPCTTAGNQLDGYLVHLHTLELREFTICGMVGTTVPPISDGFANITNVIPLPLGFEYGTTVGGAFQSLSGSDNVYHVLFRVLGGGVTIHDDPSSNINVQLPLTSQLITIRSVSTPYHYYSVCVAGGGDIKDCGYASGSPPVCRCP